MSPGSELTAVGGEETGEAVPDHATCSQRRPGPEERHTSETYLPRLTSHPRISDQPSAAGTGGRSKTSGTLVAHPARDGPSGSSPNSLWESEQVISLLWAAKCPLLKKMLGVKWDGLQGIILL